MSIVNAGQVIKNARLNAKLTQQELAEGICSTVALSKIENGKLGVSPTTFSLLMERAGSPCEALPTFRNLDDYNCFRLLRNIANEIRHYQLEKAYKSISSVIALNFADNKFYRQQTMFLYCLLQYFSKTFDLEKLKGVLQDALKISKPHINLLDIQNDSFSIIEYKCILLYINILIDTKDFEAANTLLSELNVFVRNKSLEHNNQHTSELVYIHALTYGKYLYFKKDYATALKWIDKAQDIYYSEYLGELLAYELFILKELLLLKKENTSVISDKLNYFLAAASFKKCPFIYNLIQELKNNFNFDYPLDSYTVSLKEYNNIDFPPIALSDGLFNIYDKEVISIGKLINIVRKQQGITLEKLCTGICSKSMLSKIENNSLSPTIYVAEALLGRLGIPEDYFTFYGNNEESEYQKLKKNVLASVHISKEALITSVKEFIDFAEATNNKLLLQEAASFEACLHNDKKDMYNILSRGIKITYPDFTLDNINSYSLSWTEYAIINGLLKCIYHTSDTFYTSSIFHKILINTDQPPIVNKNFSRPHQITICIYLVFLDIKKLYNETIILIVSIMEQLRSFEPYYLNFALYYYSLAKANLKQLDSLELYAQASIGNSYICNDVGIIQNFKKDIHNLTNLQI